MKFFAGFPAASGGESVQILPNSWRPGGLLLFLKIAVDLAVRSSKCIEDFKMFFRSLKQLTTLGKTLHPGVRGAAFFLGS